jgi:hypothetical protein
MKMKEMILLPQIRKQTCPTVPPRRRKNPRPAYISLSLSFRRKMPKHLDIIKKGVTI